MNNSQIHDGSYHDVDAYPREQLKHILQKLGLRSCIPKGAAEQLLRAMHTIPIGFTDIVNDEDETLPFV